MDVYPQPPGAPGTAPIPGRRTRLGAAITCAALSFLVLIGSGLAWAAFQNFNAGVPHGAAVPPLPAGASDPDGKDQNILLVGNDSRAGANPAELRALSTQNDGGSVNTDTMMVLHVPSDGANATVVSFPRDSWVTIPGHGHGKINSAYGLGYTSAKSAGQNEQSAQSAGLILTIRAIEGLTGLHIDHYMQVNLLGFYRISNAIGGVTVCLNAAQNPSTDADQFGHGYSGIDLPKGVSVIKGKQALAFVRQRHGLPGGDLDRIKRQQYFLGAAFRKITSAGVLLNPFKLRDLLTAVGSSVLTDPSLQLLKLGQQFQQMSAGKITFKTIPNLGPQLIYPDGVETSIVKVDAAAMAGFIRGLQGKPADPALAARPTGGGLVGDRRRAQRDRHHGLGRGERGRPARVGVQGQPGRLGRRLARHRRGVPDRHAVRGQGRRRGRTRGQAGADLDGGPADARARWRPGARHGRAHPDRDGRPGGAGQEAGGDRHRVGGQQNTGVGLHQLSGRTALLMARTTRAP